MLTSVRRRFTLATVFVFLLEILVGSIIWALRQLWEDRFVALMRWLYATKGTRWIAVGTDWYVANPVAGIVLVCVLTMLALWIVAFVDDRMLAHRRAATSGAPQTETLLEPLQRGQKESLEYRELSTEPEPTPNIEALEPYERPLHQRPGDPRLYRGEGTRFDTRYLAFMAPFRNDGRADREVAFIPDVRATVRAGDHRFGGYWFPANGPTVNFEVSGPTQELAVVIIDRQQRMLFVDEKRPTDEVEHVVVWAQGMTPIEWGTTITLVSEGRVVCEQRYRLSSGPNPFFRLYKEPPS
jgi:hypothetical protein